MESGNRSSPTGPDVSIGMKLLGLFALTKHQHQAVRVFRPPLVGDHLQIGGNQAVAMSPEPPPSRLATVAVPSAQTEALP